MINLARTTKYFSGSGRRMLCSKTGAAAIMSGLKKNNVTDVFLYSGGAIMPVVDLLLDPNTGKKVINYYINNHEQNCGHAATAYARSTRGEKAKPGVCIVTSGPGLTNIVTAITDAQNDSTPLVVFSGQVPVSAMGTAAFQECPAVQITTPITKWSYCARPGDDLESIVDEAFRVATSGKSGAVHIDLPKCTLANKNGNKKVFSHKNKNISRKSAGNDISDRDLLDIILKSQRPIIYAGQGANNCSSELTEFVEKLGIPITTTIHGMGAYDEKKQLSLGFLGMHGFPAANYAIQEADCIICIGARFDDRTTGNIDKYAPKCKNIIHVNIEEDEINKVIKSSDNRIVHGVVQNSKYFLRDMNEKAKENSRTNISSNGWEKWICKINKWKKQFPISYNLPGGDLVNTQMAIEEINNSIKKNLTQHPIITTGVGNHQMMAAQFIEWRSPKCYISSGSLGVMGTGLPYAIGAQIANPNEVVINIDGDGSFNHTLADLQTVAKYNLPIKIFIMNDGHMSMVRAWEKLFFKGNYVATSCSHNPDYCKLAESYGIPGVRCIDRWSLKKNINNVIKHDGPILCDVRVVPDLCLPLVAPGKGLDEMLLLDSNVDYIPGEAPS